MVRNTLADAVYAFRMMASRPGFTAVVILTLAVGIGATTAMFGTINAALLSRLPFDEPDRLVMGATTFDGNINPWTSGYDYYDYRDQNESFESLSAFMFGGRVTVLGAADPELVDECLRDLGSLPHASGQTRRGASLHRRRRRGKRAERRHDQLRLLATTFRRLCGCIR